MRSVGTTPRVSAVSVAFLAVLWQMGVAAAAVPSFAIPSGQRQLFLDNHGILSMDGLTRTMHRPDKRGASIYPISGEDKPILQTRTAPVRDPDRNVWQMWDCTRPADAAIAACGYYESTDGVNWRRPIVGTVLYHGSRSNNLVTVEGGPQLYRPDLIVRDATDPDPNRRYKAVLPNVGAAVSPDGMHWSILPGVAGVPSSDEYNFSFDEENHLFILTVKHGGPYGRAVYLSTSSDFQNWTSPTLIFAADSRDQTLGVQNIQARLADPTLMQPFYNTPAVYNVDVYNMGVFRYEGYIYRYAGAVPRRWGHPQLPQHGGVSLGPACIQP